MEPSSRRHIKCVSVVELHSAHRWAVKTKSISKKYDRWVHQTVAYLAPFLLTFHPSCRDIFDAICLVTLTHRFGELSRLRKKHDVTLIAHTLNKMNVPRLSAFFGSESLSSCVDCAPPSHSSLDATLWRALEACSAHVARVDRGRPCAMQSYAVGCVHRRHRPPPPTSPSHPGRTFFTPVAFQNVSRSDGGVSRPPGRAPCRLRTTRTDAPRPTRIP